MYAAAENHIEVCEILIDYRADVNAVDKDGCTPLMMACESGNTAIVELLINSGADLEKRQSNFEGMTALLFACDRGYFDAAILLVNAGADVNIATLNNETTPLMWAAVHGNMEFVRCLVEKGANITASHTDTDWTAESYADARKHTDISTYLRRMKERVQ
jgi:ankyrin repeat protein